MQYLDNAFTAVPSMLAKPDITLQIDFYTVHPFRTSQRYPSIDDWGPKVFPKLLEQGRLKVIYTLDG